MAFDIITYNLLSKKIKNSSTSISRIEVRQKPGTNVYQLVFVMADGKENVVELPIKPDCIDFKFVNTLPISGISTTTIYMLDKGDDLYWQYMFVDGVWTQIGISGVPYATETTAGIVKPDGITLTVDANGVMSVIKDKIDDTIEDFFDDDDNKISSDDIDDLF